MNELAGVPAFMFALINFPSWEIFIKSTIVIALAALGCRLLDRQSAALHNRVWVCGLAASLVVPMVCLSLPQFRLAVLPSAMNASRLVTTRGSRPPSPRIIAASSSPGSAGGITTKNNSPRPELDTRSTPRYPQMHGRLSGSSRNFRRGSPGILSSSRFSSCAGCSER